MTQEFPHLKANISFWSLKRMEIVELIETAISELVNQECPHCQSNTSPEHYIDRKDIEDWLEGKGII